ncbi:thymidine phosphorylase, partial [Candidatus Woesearchaeota archaeon]|nr:thymidine phosphorylase [Candidatus Woesearchaeota archaeon]
IKKSLSMAGLLLEMGRKANKGQGYQKAKDILDSGKAYEKFCEIIKAQGNAITDADKIPIGRHTFLYRAPKTGTIMDIHNKKINLIARFAGAPNEKGAGIYLYVHEGYKVKKGDKLFKICADSSRKLKLAKSVLKENPVRIR